MENKQLLNFTNYIEVKKEKVTNNSFGKINTSLLNDVVPHQEIPKRKTMGEYIMIMHLSDNVKIRIKTGSVNYAAAADLAYEGIIYVEENFGPVSFWNWEGEETVLRTPASAFPKKDTNNVTFLGKVSTFINGEDIDQISRIRRKNARKEKLIAFKDWLFGFGESEEYEYYIEEPNQPKKPLKERVVDFFYVDEEQK